MHLKNNKDLYAQATAEGICDYFGVAYIPEATNRLTNLLLLHLLNLLLLLQHLKGFRILTIPEW
jgi:hypothetical protein